MVERGLPPLHEVRLFQGLRELADDAEVEVEVEVQAVSTGSVARALARVEESGGFGTLLRRDRAACGEVLAVLSEAELSPSQGMQLLDLVVTSTHTTFTSTGELLHAWRAVAAAFGRNSGDPLPFLPKLLSSMRWHGLWLSDSWRREFATSALSPFRTVRTQT